MKKTNMIDAAAYLRMSSDKQETSLADQKKEILAYAEKHGYRIVRWYQDEGVSGWKSTQRHGFQKLIADAGNGEFKAVLCWDQSRFSRFTPLEANHYWFMLQQADCYIETVKEGRLDFETLGGWLSASVQQHGKAEYCKSLAHDVVRGRRNQVAEGRWICPAPFGYKLNRETGKLELGDAAEVEFVRQLYRMRANGMGCRHIMQAVNQPGLPKPRRSAKWSRTQIKEMLRRETYCGHMIVGKNRNGKFTHITDEVIRIENCHPAIIDQDLWNKVQAVCKRKIRVVQGRRSPKAGHLSGLLFCGCCGKVLYVNKARGGFYICSTYHMGHGCHHNKLPIATAMQFITETVRQHVLLGSLENCTERIEKILSRRAKSAAGPTVESIKKQIADIDRKLEQAAERLLEVEPSLVKSVRAAMLGLQEKRQGLEEKLADVQPAKKPMTAKQIAGELWRLDEILQNGDAAKVRAALVEIVERVEVEFTLKPAAGKGARKGELWSKPAAAHLFFRSKGDTLSTRSSSPPRCGSPWCRSPKERSTTRAWCRG